MFPVVKTVLVRRRTKRLTQQRPMLYLLCTYRRGHYFSLSWGSKTVLVCTPRNVFLFCQTSSFRKYQGTGLQGNIKDYIDRVLLPCILLQPYWNLIDSSLKKSCLYIANRGLCNHANKDLLEIRFFQSNNYIEMSVDLTYFGGRNMPFLALYNVHKIKIHDLMFTLYIYHGFGRVLL